MPQETSNSSSANNRNLLVKYGGMAVQWMVILFLAVWGGRKIDQWLKVKGSLFVWILPVFGIFGLLFQVIRDTAPRKNK
jgi:hypothetical protein